MAISSLIEIGRRALATQQTLLTTTGNNIANADTEGYSRREVTVNPTPSIMMRAGQLGTGVDATAIKRVRDDLIDRTLRQEKPVLALYREQRDALIRVEEMLNEPSDVGLNAVLSQFFNSFQALANDPENAGVRTTVLGTGEAVASTFQRIDRQINDLRDQLLNKITDKVDQVNELTTEIANLNRRIAGLERTNKEASAERDRRDLLVDNLSDLISVSTAESANGTIHVSAGDTVLVVGSQATELKMRSVQMGESIVTHVVKAETDEILETSGGGIHGLLKIRDEDLVYYQQRLDDIARTLAREVNLVHEAGYGTDGQTGRLFFTDNVTGASDIAVHDDVTSNIEAIASSQDGARGDNRNAQVMADIEFQPVIGSGALTLSESYRGIVGDIAARTRSFTTATETQELIVAKLENDRIAVSGVSLDEEAANLIVQQRAYQAAARLVRTADELTEALLAMTR